jgi:hypothetical protein
LQLIPLDEYLLLPQFEHESALAAENWPPVHDEQLVLPTAAYVPAEHCVQEPVLELLVQAP